MKFKGIILIVGVLLSLATVAQPPGGQGQGRQFDPEQMIKRQTDQMVTDLGLNADQTKKVEALNRKYSDKMREMFQANRDAGGDFSQMREKMTALREEKNKELKPILTEDQMKKYLELEQKRMEERRQRFGGGQGGPPPGRRGQQRGGGN